MALAEALWPILARWVDAVVGCKGLEGGGTLTLDNMCYGTLELDRWRVSTFVHTQHVFEDSGFLLGSEILLAGRLVSSCRLATGVAPGR